MADIIQKAAEWDKHSAKLRKQFPTVDALTDQVGTYHWQPKYDGIHAIIDTTERIAFTLAHTPLPSIQHIVDTLSDRAGHGFVFQGEVWLPGVPFKDISGAARRHALQPHLGVVLYDVHDEVDWAGGKDRAAYGVRLGMLRHLHAMVCGDPLIRLVESYAATDDKRPIGGWNILAQDYVKQGGYDGLILRDMSALWAAGPSRNGELIKVKPSVTLDLRCNGVIQGEGKHAGKLGALIVSYNGVGSAVGTGFSDEERENFWRAATNARSGAAAFGFNPIGKIIEVECMCVNPNNTLREPRFKAVRWDKTTAD